jgi:hypothetical protein
LPAKSTGKEMKFPQSSPAYKNMTQNWWNSKSKYHHTKLPKHLLPKHEFVPKRFWNKVAIHTISLSLSLCKAMQEEEEILGRGFGATSGASFISQMT